MKFDDYERSRWADYAAFGETVAAILRAAIAETGGYRLQQVRSRAKDAASLRKKLEKRGEEKDIDLLVADTLEGEIKDLAGCRVIFYTNTDVSKLIASGLIETNFEVVETKLHHPRRDADDATELYISNHYLVKLRDERLALPEYARFAGMRCEIQIQTILNHAWAEMAHDTIYKQPELDTFGTKALDAIKARMGKIARKYLLPAGHEFAKVAADFERLIKGEALFKGQALEAIVEAIDNNARADALDTFIDAVLPLYDDVAPELPDILDAMREAVERAAATPPVPVETPYGTLPAKTQADVLRRIAKLIEQIRYVDPEAVFETLLDLYGHAPNDEARKPLVEAGERLAQHNIHVWRKYGPAVQTMLVERIDRLGKSERRAALPLLAKMLEAIVGTELSGTSSSSGAVTFHRSPVLASTELFGLRRKSIAQLKALYGQARDDGERGSILGALRTATRPPMGSGYGPELVETLMESSAELIEFEAEQAPAMSWELRQREESAVLRQARINRGLQADLLAVPAVEKLRDRIHVAVATFRAAVDADAEYAIYKVLVGFDVVYPPAWQSERFGYAEERAYRETAIDAMIDGIGPDDGAVWHARAVRCAETESNDLATFPMFNKFLERLAAARPAIVLAWLVALEPPLVRFLPPMLIGLQKSDRAKDAADQIMARIEQGHWLGEIIWFQRYAESFDEAILVAALGKAIAIDDRDAVRTAMAVAGDRYRLQPGTLIEAVLMPALAHMQEYDDRSWIGRGFGSWYHGEIMTALSEVQATKVLIALLTYPEIEHGAAHIVGAIAKSWPEQVLTFFGGRDAIADSDARPDGFEAIPFSLDEVLATPLAAHADLVLAEVRGWYDREPQFFQYRGGRLVSSLYPNVAEPLAERLAALIEGSRDDIGFVLEVLNAFEGVEQIEPQIKQAVSRLQPGDELLQQADRALEQSGVVTGEYGFAERCQMRLERMRAWQHDADPRVKVFADEQVKYLERRVAAETRRAEASVAARRLEYGEELDPE